MPNLVEIGSVFLEKILKCQHCTFAILQLHPLGDGPGPSFEKKPQTIQFPPTKDTLCQIWLR